MSLKSNGSSLCSVCEFDSILTVKQLLLQGPDVTKAREIDGNTPLLCAASSKIDSADKVRLLLKYYVPHTVLNKHKQNALHMSSNSGNVEGLIHILEYVSSKYSQDLHNLLNAYCNKGYTPLVSASKNGHAHCVKALKLYGAPVMVTSSGIHPLIAAALSNSPRCIVALCSGEKCQVLNQCDENGNTPLHHAVRTGALEAVQVLVGEGANIKQNNLGQTPLDLAKTDSRIKQFLQDKTQHTASFSIDFRPPDVAHIIEKVRQEYVIANTTQKANSPSVKTNAVQLRPQMHRLDKANRVSIPETAAPPPPAKPDMNTSKLSRKVRVYGALSNTIPTLSKSSKPPRPQQPPSKPGKTPVPTFMKSDTSPKTASTLSKSSYTPRPQPSQSNPGMKQAASVPTLMNSSFLPKTVSTLSKSSNAPPKRIPPSPYQGFPVGNTQNMHERPPVQTKPKPYSTAMMSADVLLPIKPTKPVGKSNSNKSGLEATDSSSSSADSESESDVEESTSTTASQLYDDLVVNTNRTNTPRSGKAFESEKSSLDKSITQVPSSVNETTLKTSYFMGTPSETDKKSIHRESAVPTENILVSHYDVTKEKKMMPHEQFAVPEGPPPPYDSIANDTNISSLTHNLPASLESILRRNYKSLTKCNPCHLMPYLLQWKVITFLDRENIFVKQTDTKQMEEMLGILFRKQTDWPVRLVLCLAESEEVGDNSLAERFCIEAGTTLRNLQAAYDI